MPTGVLWRGPVLDRGGYGAVARGYVLALQRRGIPVRTLNTGAVHEEVDPETARLMHALADADVGPRPVLVHHGEPAGFATPPPIPVERTIGCTIFETDRIPEEWVAPCNAVDELWVPSHFNRDTFARSGVEPGRIRVLPYAIDPDEIEAARRAPHAAPLPPGTRDYRFLYTFALDYRKGVELLLEAFLREFQRRDNVALVLKCYVPPYFHALDGAPDDDLATRLQRGLAGRVDLFADDLPQVRILEGAWPREAQLALHLDCDAYVSTDRANGWGMPCMESMALGKPTATVDWSGSTEFMNGENSFLIHPTGRLEPVDPRLEQMRPIYRGHLWAEVEVDAVRAVLREMFENRAHAAQVGERARRDMQAHFGVDTIARRMTELLGIEPKTTVDAQLTPRPAVSTPPTPPVELTYDSPLLDLSGYASMARALLLGLDAAGVAVCAAPNWGAGVARISRVGVDQVPIEARALALAPGAEVRFAEGAEGVPHRLFLPGSDGSMYAYETYVEPDRLERLLRLAARPIQRRDVYVIHMPPVSSGIDLYGAARTRNPGYRCYAGSTMFETEGLPSGWAEACNRMDEVWVPSTFNRRTFVRAGVDPAKLFVLQPGLDVSLFDPDVVEPLRFADIPSFTFLSVFQWTRRKGWDILLDAYLDAFDAHEDVALVLRAYQSNGISVRDRVEAYLRERGVDPACGPRIVLYDQALGERQMPALYAGCDAFVLPSRGEGWGYPYLEAMAMGKPVIGTRCGGNVDFMNDANSYLIDVDGLAPVEEEQVRDNPLYRGLELAEPSRRHTTELMRRVFDEPEAARCVGKRARGDVQAHWTTEHAALRVREHLASWAELR